MAYPDASVGLDGDRRRDATLATQLMERDESYKADKDALLLSSPLHGSVFTKTYRDPLKNRNVVENVRAVDLVVPYGTGPRRLEDIERKTHIIWRSPAPSRWARHLLLRDSRSLPSWALGLTLPRALSRAEAGVCPGSVLGLRGT